MTGAMMAYAPSGSSAVGAHQRGPLIDWRFGRLYENGATADGLRYYDFYPNGVEIRGRTNADIGVSSTTGPWTFCYNAQFFAVNQDLSNGASILYLRPGDFTLVDRFGVASSSGTSTPTNIPQPTCLVSIQVANEQEDIIIANSTFTTGELNAITVGGRNLPLGAVDENHTVLGALPDGSGTSAYAIGYTKVGAYAQIGLYRIPAGALGIVPIAKVLPASVDPAWVQFNAPVNGIAIDQTDGNLIVGLSNSAGAVKAYIVKLNATTGAVMWAIPVTNGINGDGNDDFKQNLITRGILYYIDFGGTLFTINTVAGTFTSAVFSNVLVGALHSAQISEDVTGSIIWFGSWSEGATHPTYLGDYCLTRGNHSGANLVWRFFPNGVPNPYLPVYGVPAESRRRAWSFALDGHVFYVLDLGQQGTFLYDDSTNQWSKFITQGHNGWNLTNGTMWGTQRIVGGDFISSSIWEMQPAAGMDNDTVDIIHVVTGGLTKRSRVYSSLEAVRLNCAFGQLADTVDATVLLEFSDDQGQTFTAADILSLTQGDFTGEIAWRSLGSFAAPGRIFRITDVGAFLRIDGADGFVDNFDADMPQGAPTGGGQ